MTEQAAGSILVVDDQESSRYVLGAWLRRAGYTVVEAPTGTEGMARVKDQEIDLAILDVNLPDMTGYELCEWIKRNGSIPVIHISATATEVADRTQGITRGADAYLVEPVDREELLATIGASLRSSRARRRSENLVALLGKLTQTTIQIHAATSLWQILNAAASGACTIFDAPAVVAMMQEGTTLAASCLPGRVESNIRNLTRDLMPALTETGGGASLAAAMLPAEWQGRPIRISKIRSRRDETVGRIVIVDEGALEADEARLLLSLLAQSVSVAAQNVRALEAEQHIALTLQRSLLPAHLEIRGVELAVRYEAGSEQLEVGGDFFDAFQIDETSVGIAIGDVVGHSLAAATVMAEIRHSLRSYAIEGLDPAVVLERVDAQLAHFHPDMTATMAFGVLTPKTGLLRFTNAGHIPALVVGPEGSRFLEMDGAMLGVGITERSSRDFTLGSQEVLVLVTDGLVEQRGTSIDSNLSRLASVAMDNFSNLEVLCHELIAQVGPGPSGFDDLAILAVRREAADARLAKGASG